MTTHAQHVENLVSLSNEIALKADKISQLAATIDLAIALNDVPKRDEIASVTVGLDPTRPLGGPAELLRVTGTDGMEYRDFDELFDLVHERVFLNGPGVPADLLAGPRETFDVQALIAKIPALGHELEDEVDALRTFMADA